jgi:rubrerythrin
MSLTESAASTSRGASDPVGGGEYRCSECGYGVVVAHAPPRCPMCRGVAWEAVAWRPFTRRVDVGTELQRS